MKIVFDVFLLILLNLKHELVCVSPVISNVIIVDSGPEIKCGPNCIQTNYC